MKKIFKVGLIFLILSGVMFVTAAGLFTYTGNVNSFVIDLGEFAITTWIPLVIIGVFLVIVGSFIDQD